MDKLYLLVDSSKVAFYKRTAEKKARFANLEIIRKYLEKQMITQRGEVRGNV